MSSRKWLFLLVGGFVSLGANPPIDLRRFWPQPNAGEALVVRFNSGRVIIYRKADDGYTLEDYWHIDGRPDEPGTLKWSSTWHYRIDAQDGVIEYGDDMPGTVGQPMARSRFMRGNEIIWGKMLPVGGQIDQKVAYANAPNRTAFARNRVMLLSKKIGTGAFTNVIRLRDRQDVCGGSTGRPGSLDQAGPISCTNYETSTTDYDFGPGIGFIRLAPLILKGQSPVIKNEIAIDICHIPVGQVAYCPRVPQLPAHNGHASKLRVGDRPVGR